MKFNKISNRIFELRMMYGLSQSQLALLMGTSQAVVSRLEDTNYDGHSLKMLKRVADALQCELQITLTPKNGFTSIEAKYKENNFTTRSPMIEVQRQGRVFYQVNQDAKYRELRQATFLKLLGIGGDSG